MVHRTVFAILYTPGTKQPVRGRQLDLSVVQKLETTLLEHVVRTYSVRLGVHPIWQMRYLCENSALFFAFLSSVRLLRLFCVPHAFFRHSPPPKTLFYLRLCFFQTGLVFPRNNEVETHTTSTLSFALRPMAGSSAATSLRRGSRCERRWD